MELGQQQVVPRLVEAAEMVRQRRVVGGEGPRRLFGLRQQMLAMALGALDVVHDAVAAGEGVLQLGRHRRQQVPLVGDRRP